ncbi:MAG: hypothetical protein AABW80_04675 [Nanoarchaeota archaeon]
MKKRKSDKKVEIIILIIVLLAVVAVSLYSHFKPFPLFNPDDGVCDPGEDPISEDCQGLEPPCDPTDENGPCYVSTCKGVIPSSECIGTDGKTRTGYIGDCKYCDGCGQLDSSYVDGTRQDDVAVCNVCSGGETVGAPAGEMVNGNPCTVCDGNGGTTAVPDGPAPVGQGCSICTGGNLGSITGNFPWDVKSQSCEKCSASNHIIPKDAGEFCQIYVGGNFVKYVKGECDGVGECGLAQCKVNSCFSATQTQIDSWGIDWMDKLAGGLDLSNCKAKIAVLVPGNPKTNSPAVIGVCFTAGF